jgi:hypothetical protein
MKKTHPCSLTGPSPIQNHPPPPPPPCTNPSSTTSPCCSSPRPTP